MGKNNKKILTKIGVGLGSTALAVGGISSVLTSCAHTGSKYTYTWDNVYSIQKSFLKFYLDRLNKEGFPSNEIEQKMQQASNDIDTIIKNGQQSGLSRDESIQLTYADLWNYSKAKQVDPFDWKMFDDFVVKFKDQLHDTIYSSSLPKDQKDAIWQKYNSFIDNEITLIKNKASSSTEAINMFKEFGENFARDELKDQRNHLVTYYLLNFFHQHPLSASNLFYDEVGFGSLKKGDVLPYGWFQSSNTNDADSNNDDSIDFGGNTEMLSSLCIDAGCINRFYKLDTTKENYTFQCLFSRYDDQLHRLYYHGKIIDNNDPSITAITTQEQFVTLKESSAKRHSLMVESLQQHSFNFESPKITMLDWANIFRTLSPNSQQDQKVSADSQVPLLTDEGLQTSSHMFFVDNICFGDLDNTTIQSLTDAFSFNLNVYAYDEVNNTVTYSVDAKSNDDGYADESPYVLFPKQTIKFNSGIDQTAINNLKQSFSTLDSIQRANSQKIESSMQKLYILNASLAAEQFAMAVVSMAFSVMYFAAIPFTFGTTTKMGVMAAIGVYACLIGGALSTWAAVEYKKKYDEIKTVRAQPEYSTFETQFNNFKNSDDGHLIISSRFGTEIGISIFMRITNVLSAIAKYYSKSYFIAASASSLARTFDEYYVEPERQHDYFHNLADAYAPAPTKAYFGKLFSSIQDRSVDVGVNASNAFMGSIFSTITQSHSDYASFVRTLRARFPDNLPTGAWFKPGTNMGTLRQIFLDFWSKLIGQNGHYQPDLHLQLSQDIWGEMVEALIRRCSVRSTNVPRGGDAFVENFADFMYNSLNETGINIMLERQQLVASHWLDTIGNLRRVFLDMSRGESEVPHVGVRVLQSERLVTPKSWTEAEKATQIDAFSRADGVGHQVADFQRIVFVGEDAEKVKEASDLFFVKMARPFSIGNGSPRPRGLDPSRDLRFQQASPEPRLVDGEGVGTREQIQGIEGLGGHAETTSGLTIDEIDARNLALVRQRFSGIEPKPFISKYSGTRKFKIEIAIAEQSELEGTFVSKGDAFLGEAVVRGSEFAKDSVAVEKIPALYYAPKVMSGLRDAAQLSQRMTQRVMAAGDAGVEAMDFVIGWGSKARFVVDGVVMSGFKGWRAFMLKDEAGMASLSTLEKAMVSDLPFIELVVGATDFIINIVAIVLQSVWG